MFMSITVAIFQRYPSQGGFGFEVLDTSNEDGSEGQVSIDDVPFDDCTTAAECPSSLINSTEPSKSGICANHKA